MKKSQPQRGVTMVEILVVLSIFAVMIGGVVLNLRQPQASATSAALAQVVAQELRAARRLAQNQGTPVAVVFPSAAATRGHSQSLYILEGWPHPKVSRVHNYKGDFPMGYLFVGQWATSETVALAPADRPAVNLARWLTPPNRDYVVAFAPDGSVVTNDLPWFNGELRIVACAGLSAGPAVVPAGSAVAFGSTPGYFALTQVFQPQTVCVSREGTVSVQPGLRGASGVNIGSGTAVPNIPPAAPPSMTGGANQAPTILSVKAYPEVCPGLPPGYTNGITSDGFLTLVVRALDPNNGDQLSTTFQCAGGQFSEVPGGSRMRFDPNDTDPVLYPAGCWKSVWIWSPPRDPVNNYAPPGTGFDITCTVTDDHGLSTSNFSDGTLARVQLLVCDLGHIFFSGLYKGQQRLFSLAPDGSAPCLISDGAVNFDITEPSVSPDGTKVVYCANPGGGDVRIFICNVDGTDVVEIAHTPGVNLSSPTWSADGTRVAFAEMTTPPWVKVVQTSGVGPVEWVAQGSKPRWSLALPAAPPAPAYPGGRITYLDGANQVCVVDPIGSGVAVANPPSKTVINASTAMTFPCWTPEGLVAYIEPGSNTVWRTNPNNPALTLQLANTLVGLQGPISFSPDASKVVMSCLSYGMFATYSPLIIGSAPFQVYPEGPTGGSISVVGYPSWSTR